MPHVQCTSYVYMFVDITQLMTQSYIFIIPNCTSVQYNMVIP